MEQLARKVLQLCAQNLMGYAGEGLLDQNAQRILGPRLPVHEALEVKKRFL